MKLRSDGVVRDALADMLGILEYKVRHDAMTVDDMRAVLDVLESNGGVKAFIDGKARQGIAVTAKRLREAVERWKDNYFVTQYFR